MTHYNPGAGKMKSFTSDDNFEIPLTAYKNVDPIAIPVMNHLEIKQIFHLKTCNTYLSNIRQFPETLNMLLSFLLI